jgi:hypothetical protein
LTSPFAAIHHRMAGSGHPPVTVTRPYR